MRIRLPVACALLLSGRVPASQETKPDRSTLDSPMREYRPKDVMKDAEIFVSLADFRCKKTVVLIFISYACDACEDDENRIKKLIKDFAEKAVVLLGIRSSTEDDAAGMREYAESHGFKMPILDGPRNLLADDLGVIVTPSFYVIDPKGVLRYRGSYDETIQEARAQKTYVHNALRKVLDGKGVALKTTLTIGCHLPRVEPGK
jgi:peroxiredoxin